MITVCWKRVLCLFTILFYQGLCYEIPEVKIELMRPKGLKATIPHSDNMTLFAFQGNVNKPISQTDVGLISGEVIEPKDGRWTVIDSNVKLQKGDVISYYVFVSIDGLGYIKDGLSYVVGDAPGITSVEFIGTVNNFMYEAGQSQSSNGHWTMQVPDVTLDDGDVVHYNVFVTLNGDDTYFKDGLQYTVHGKQRVPQLQPPHTTSTTTTPRPTTQAYVPPPTMPAYVPPPTTTTTQAPTEPPTTECPRSVTTIRGQGSVCAGQVIFEDHFNTLNENTWRIEHKIPTDHLEFPFVSYQRSRVRVHRLRGQGQLVIEPKPQDTMPNFNEDKIFQGINLGANCTGRSELPEQCVFQADGPDIVRPVASGRITTRNFAFKYGKVEVEAKLPQGDWLYPELLLEEASPWSEFNGFMKIASARGNRYLQDYSGNEYGSELLYGGVAYNPNCGPREFQQVNKRHRFHWFDRKTWPDDFHHYTLLWTPTGITLMVDGEVMGSELQPPFQGVTCDPRKRSTEMSPFDRDYKLSFGVAVGGMWVFEDDLSTIPDGRHIWNKPWKNVARKAMLKFYRAQKHWYPTWEENSNLQIRYVKITAL